ncbi:hypothetical protein LXL04_005821 [Taraxacum kok-saghyz]
MRKRFMIICYALLWGLWKFRNDRLFRDFSYPLQSVRIMSSQLLTLGLSIGAMGSFVIGRVGLFLHFHLCNFGRDSSSLPLVRPPAVSFLFSGHSTPVSASYNSISFPSRSCWLLQRKITPVASLSFGFLCTGGYQEITTGCCLLSPQYEFVPFRRRREVESWNESQALIHTLKIEIVRLGEGEKREWSDSIVKGYAAVSRKDTI